MNRRTRPQAATSLQTSAQDDRRSRMLKYTIAMAIRTVCVVLLVFVREWWLMLIIVTAAIVLPYFAVVVATVSTKDKGRAVERPGAVVPVPPMAAEPRGRAPRDE